MWLVWDVIHSTVGDDVPGIIIRIHSKGRMSSSFRGPESRQSLPQPHTPYLGILAKRSWVSASLPILFCPDCCEQGGQNGFTQLILVPCRKAREGGLSSQKVYTTRNPWALSGTARNDAQRIRSLLRTRVGIWLQKTQTLGLLDMRFGESLLT